MDVLLAEFSKVPPLRVSFPPPEVPRLYPAKSKVPLLRARAAFVPLTALSNIHVPVLTEM